MLYQVIALMFPRLPYHAFYTRLWIKDRKNRAISFLRFSLPNHWRLILLGCLLLRLSLMILPQTIPEEEDRLYLDVPTPQWPDYYVRHPEYFGMPPKTANNALPTGRAEYKRHECERECRCGESRNSATVFAVALPNKTEVSTTMDVATPIVTAFKISR